MTGKHEGGESGLDHVDIQLLLQFADQGGLGRLAGLELAAGEFPEAGERLALGALGDEHPAVGVDQRTGGDQQQALSALGHVSLPSANRNSRRRH